jgi:hypothetical protein
MFARRQLTLIATSAVAAMILRVLPAIAASKDEAAVADAVEAFRKAMVANDHKALTTLTADGLSYGHSGGKIQNKAEFIDGAMKSTWKSITQSNQTIEIAGTNAIVRFTFTGQNESQGKINDVKLGILMVWVRQSSDWQLLARQGYKV